jgi:hypothetical protein
MKISKSILALLIVFMITCSTLVSAASEPQINDKAKILNNLSILVGNGVDFNLNGQLSRSEAIAFIIRMMGQESFVINNKDKYSATTFSDVKKTDWFASTVGYAVEQKLVVGFPDGKFHPNDKISEKSFLLLLLGVLGYKSTTDFTWDTIYSFAADVKLVDQNYDNFTKDNLQYKRKDVVKALYTSLLLTHKQTNKTMIDMLDPTHVLVPSLAPPKKPDALVTTISSVSVTNETNFNIQFNEIIKAINAKNIMIYETGNKDKLLKFTLNSQVNNKLIINTEPQKPNQSYTIDIYNVFDLEDNNVSLLHSGFLGYVIPEIKSDFFKISKIETISNNMLNIYFTQPIDTNAELPMYYEIMYNGSSLTKGSFANMSVKTISNKNNAVTLLLKNEFISQAGTYSLKISGELNNIYGLKINDGTGDTVAFSANTTENSTFNLLDVMPLDLKTIQVTFNQEVDPSTSQQVSNYTIINSNGVPVSVIKAIVSGEGDQKGKTVKLLLVTPIDINKNYVITIKNIINKTNQISLTESKYAFYGQGILARKDLEVVNVTPFDNSTLYVYFDRKLDAISSINPSLYVLSGVTNTGFVGSISKVYYNPSEPYQVKLYLGAGQSLAAGDTYKLHVMNAMQDELGIMSISNTSINFQGNGNVNIKPLIYEATIISKYAIRFKTSEEILNIGANLNTNNYVLEYKDSSNNTITKLPTSMSLVDATTGLLRFDSLDPTKIYTLRFSSLTDYANLYSRVNSDGLTTVGVIPGTN